MEEIARTTVFRAGATAGLGCLAVVLAACSRPEPSVLEGRSLYNTNGCASCHGPSGHGDGPLAASLVSQPTDLRNAALFKRGYGESEIAKTLAEGVTGGPGATPQLHHTHHELAMPKFDHLTAIERRSIALYVVSLRDDSNQRRSSHDQGK